VFAHENDVVRRVLECRRKSGLNPKDNGFFPVFVCFVKQWFEIRIAGYDCKGVYIGIIDQFHALYCEAHIHITGTDYGFKSMVFNSLDKLVRGILVQENASNLDIPVVLQNVPNLLEIYIKLFSEDVRSVYQKAYFPPADFFLGTEVFGDGIKSAFYRLHYQCPL